MAHSNEKSITPEKCSYCPGAFFDIIQWQGYSHPVCLNCWSLFQDRISNIKEQNIREMNQLLGEMEWSTGLPSGTMPRYELPPTKHKTIVGDLVLNNIKVERSAVGTINTGTIGNLQNIDASLTILGKDPSFKSFQKVIQEFSEAVVNAQDASKEQKEVIFELISSLTEEVRSPKEKRRPSVMWAVIKEIAEYAKVITSIQALWNGVVYPVISQLFSKK